MTSADKKRDAALMANFYASRAWQKRVKKAGKHRNRQEAKKDIRRERGA